VPSPKFHSKVGCVEQPLVVAVAAKFIAALAPPVAGTVAPQLTVQVCKGSRLVVGVVDEAALPTVLSKDAAASGLLADESLVSAKDRFAAKPNPPVCANKNKKARKPSATVKVANFDCLVKRVSESRRYPLNKDIIQQLLLVY
jgi:hypothetical protein